MTDCTSIRHLLVDDLISHTGVQQINDGCVVTLPLSTLDNRWVDVFVEPRGADYFLINDGGKAVNELILQGMKITPSIERVFISLAKRLRVAYVDEMFQTGTKLTGITDAISNVGMCSALAMTELLDYMPAVPEEPLNQQLESALRSWGKSRMKIDANVRNVPGTLKQHSFDFVITPRKGGTPISISILNPTAGPLSAAERFGFKTKDLIGNWKNAAVETKAEVWSEDSRRIVDRTADVVIPIRTGERPTLELIRSKLDPIAA